MTPSGKHARRIATSSAAFSASAAARRAVDSGKGAVEASRRNVEFGTGTEFDLLNAQNNYYAAVRAYSQTRYDYLTSVLTLKQQAGRLSERDLGAVDDMLIQTGT